jgi:hypothetical protein
VTTTYSVHVEVGSYSWDVTGNDTDGDLAPAYGLADPLVIQQRWPDSDLAPNVQPNPMEATLSVIAPNSSTYAFSIGDPVAVEFYTQGGFTGPTQQFYGRVATATARPHDLGVFYTLGCVDYTVDLAETDPVGTVAYPAELPVNRLARVMAEARVPMMATYPGPTIVTSNQMQARAASPVSLLDYILQLLSQWRVNDPVDELGNAATSGQHFTRPTLRQFISNKRLYPVTPYYLDWRDQGRKIAYSPPGRLSTVGGLLTIGMSVANSSPSTGSVILDGGNVELDTTFSQVKGPSSVSRVTVTDADGVVAGAGDTGGAIGQIVYPSVPPTTNVQANLDAPDFPSLGGAPFEGLTLQQLYAPDQATGRPAAQLPWSVGELTWLAWHEATGWLPPVLGQLLTICRVVASKVPNNREWVSGIVSGWTLTVAGGRPQVAISLESPNLNTAQIHRNHLGASLGVASWDSPILSTPTFAQLSTRDSFDDYRLVRGS